MTCGGPCKERGLAEEGVLLRRKCGGNPCRRYGILRQSGYRGCRTLATACADLDGGGFAALWGWRQDVVRTAAASLCDWALLFGFPQLPSPLHDISFCINAAPLGASGTARAEAETASDLPGPGAGLLRGIGGDGGAGAESGWDRGVLGLPRDHAPSRAIPGQKAHDHS